MLLSPAPTLPTGPGWAYEVKWDGMRTLASIDRAGAVRVWSRHGRDHTDAFPELQALGELAGQGPLVLDGELVCLDPETGRPSFDRLMARVLSGLPSVAARQHPATLMAFDLLSHAGANTCSLPWTSRRNLLQGLLGDPGGRSWRLNTAFPDGQALLAQTAEMGLEGVVAKRCQSRYLPGRRTQYWRKVKHQTVEWFDCLGWVPPRERDRGGLIVAEEGRRLGVAFPALDPDSRRLFAAIADEVGTEDRGVVRLPFGAVEVQVAYLERLAGGRLREPIGRRVRRAGWAGNTL